MNRTFLIFTLTVIFIAALWVIIPMAINNVKEPDFKIIQAERNIQLRQYAPYIVAEVKVSGERGAAASQGFRLIAGYIFGGNQSKTASANKNGAEKIAMTAPVIQQKDSEKIAMTAPVIQQKDSEKVAMTAPVIQQLTDDGSWTVQFVMPKEYTLATLPTPDDKRVELKQVASKQWLAIKFSGIWSKDNIEKHFKQLMDYANSKNLQTVGAPRTAFYNAPWTLPPLRRNEVMIEIK